MNILFKPVPKYIDKDFMKNIGYSNPGFYEKI